MTPAAMRCHERLEAMGFVRDVDRSNRERSVWSHPNDPGQQIRIFVGIKDDAATLKLRHAEQIAGLAATETPEPTAKDRQRERRQADAARRVAAMIAHDRQLAPFQAAADQRAAEKKKREVLRQRSRLLDRWQDAREQLARTQQCGHDTRRAVAAVADARQAIDRFDAEHPVH